MQTGRDVRGSGPTEEDLEYVERLITTTQRSQTEEDNRSVGRGSGGRGGV